MIRIHQAERRRDDAMAIGIGVIAKGDLKTVLQSDKAGHRIRTRTIHANLAVVIQGHEAKRRIDLRIHHRKIEPVTLGDLLPISQCRAAERIDTDLDLSRMNRFHVDDRSQILDVGAD